MYQVFRQIQNPSGEPSPFAELLHGPGTVLSPTMHIMCMTNICVVIILLHFTKEEITETAASPEQGRCGRDLLQTHLNRTFSGLILAREGNAFIYSHFTNKKTEAQSGHAYTQDHRASKWQRWNLNQGPSDSFPVPADVTLGLWRGPEGWGSLWGADTQGPCVLHSLPLEEGVHRKC